MRERSVASACRSRFSLRRAPPVFLTPIRPARSSAPCPLFPPSLPSSSSAPFRSAPLVPAALLLLPPAFVLCSRPLPPCSGLPIASAPFCSDPRSLHATSCIPLSLPRISGPCSLLRPRPAPHILPSRLPPPPPHFLPAASHAPCPSAPRLPLRPFRIPPPRLLLPPSPPSAVERRGLLPFPRLFVRAFW